MQNLEDISNSNSAEIIELSLSSSCASNSFIKNEQDKNNQILNLENNIINKKIERLNIENNNLDEMDNHNKNNKKIHNQNNNSNQQQQQQHSTNTMIDSTNRAIQLDIEKPIQVLDKAATKIQSTFRGYKTRKNIKRSNLQNEHHRDIKPSKQKKRNSLSEVRAKSTDSKRIVFDPELAATKIQSTYRGYQTRKQLNIEKPAKSKNSANKN